ncbi:hypothetical protein CSE45_1476 [Citreicella sp. SE45]|nr:hypothetical protein CSE45_1476 [Citreicella sp. SE45]
MRQLLLLHTAHRGEHHRHHVLEIAWVAPVEAEDLGEDDAMLGTVHETGVQRPVEVHPVGEPRRRHRADGVDHPARAHGQPGPPQRPGEVDDVLREPRVVRHRDGQVFRHVTPWRFGDRRHREPDAGPGRKPSVGRGRVGGVGGGPWHGDGVGWRCGEVSAMSFSRDGRQATRGDGMPLRMIASPGDPSG